MEAIVLCGGKGTRLKSIVRDIPKPMADIHGKPFLEYLLDYLSIYGFSTVVLAVSYRYEIIQNHFGQSHKSISLIYSVEDKPLGTGGAIKQALSFTSGEHVFVLNGDSYNDL